MVNLGPIDFQMGLSLNINENDGQNKFKVNISKIWPISAQNRPGRHFCPNFELALLGNFSSDFYVRHLKNNQLVKTDRMVEKN